MPLSRRNIALRDSERAPLHGAQLMGEAPPEERIQVTLRLRSRSSKKDPLKEEWGDPLPQNRKYLTREEFEARHGADPQDFGKIENFATEHHLAVVEADAARRAVVLTGTSASVSAAFGVRRLRYDSPSGSYCGHSEPVHIPAALEGIVEGVLGLDDRRQAKRSPQGRRVELEVATPTKQVSYNPTQLAHLYNFPAGVDGQGQCIALIELSGGYRHQDLVAYFKLLALPLPRVSAVSVHGVINNPEGRTQAYDREVVGDIQVVGGIAPGASLVVYFASNTDQGFFDAVTKAIHDKQHRPSIISISWGDSECTWTPLTRRLLNEALEEAAGMGVTILCSSGDQGSSNGVPGDSQHVNFPASSPNVLACGGTSMVCSGDKIVKETVWNDALGVSGGGVSEDFPLPDWQTRVHVPVSANPAHHKGRGVPDVAATAEGYSILVNGKQTLGGGTSAVAPLWAGLVARINQKLGHPVGYLNPLFYQEYGRLCSLGAFREVTEGHNGAYAAGKSWNACTGLGTPDGHKLFSALTLRRAAKA
jgi:kumamolisin